MGKTFREKTGGGSTRNQKEQSQCQDQDIKQRRDEDLQECCDDLQQCDSCQ